MAKTKIKEAPQRVQTEKQPERKLPFGLQRDELICNILLVVLLLLVASIRSKFSGIPFERDEGIYAYNGIKVLEGKVPYVDFYEQKFPGIFYFFALMVAIFGQTVEGLHMGWTVLNLISIFLIYLAAKKLFSPLAGIFAAITYAFISLSPNLSGFTIQSEHAVAMFISLGIYFYAHAQTRGAWYFYLLMGLSFGISFMVKTSGMFLVLFGGLMTIADHLLKKDRNWKMLFKNTAIYSAGVFAVIGFFFLIVTVQGGFDQMIYWSIEVPKKYVGKIPFEDGKKYFKYTLDALLLTHKFLWVHAALAGILLFFKNIPLRLRIMAVLLAFFSFMTIVPGYYFYGHYWIQLVPGLSILSAMTFWGITGTLKDRMGLKWPALSYAYLVVFILFTVTHMSKMRSYYFHPNYEVIMRQVYGSNPFPEAMEIGKFINQNTKPEDNIAIIGSEPQIYLYTGKKCPSRHAYFAALVNDAPEHKAWQREFVKDVEAANPKYFVFFKHGISLFVQPNTDNYIFEWVNKYATSNYHLKGVIDMVDNQKSNYIWNEAVNTFQPKGQNQIFIFERNT